jgi:hypothetical protein
MAIKDEDAGGGGHDTLACVAMDRSSVS